jgi:hypothetical protein
MSDNILCEIRPGKYVMRNGKYAQIRKRITMGIGQGWQGNVLSHFSHRGGLQNLWDENGRDMGGLSQYDLVSLAVIETDSVN